MIFTREKVKAKKKKKNVSAKPSLHLIFRMPVSDKLILWKELIRDKE